MIDREKVKKGLECCKASTSDDPFRQCSECPYNDISISVQECRAVLSADALELLKEQEAEWIEYPECLVYDGAYFDSHIVCSACKHVFSIMDNCTEEFDYCPHCGAKMKHERR